MSHNLFCLYICYWCSVLQDGEFFCSLEYGGILLQISVSLSHFWDKVGKRKEPVDIPPCRSTKAFVIHTALEIPWLMYCCFKIYIHKLQVWRNASSTVMLQPGPARAGDGSKEWQIWCPQHIYSWEEMFGCICARREKQQLLIGSLRHIRVHHHTKQTVSSQMKKEEEKKPQH